MRVLMAPRYSLLEPANEAACAEDVTAGETACGSVNVSVDLHRVYQRRTLYSHVRSPSELKADGAGSQVVDVLDASTRVVNEGILGSQLLAHAFEFSLERGYCVACAIYIKGEDRASVRSPDNKGEVRQTHQLRQAAPQPPPPCAHLLQSTACQCYVACLCLGAQVPPRQRQRSCYATCVTCVAFVRTRRHPRRRLTQLPERVQAMEPTPCLMPQREQPTAASQE